MEPAGGFRKRASGGASCPAMRRIAAIRRASSSESGYPVESMDRESPPESFLRKRGNRTLLRQPAVQGVSTIPQRNAIDRDLAGKAAHAPPALRAPRCSPGFIHGLLALSLLGCEAAVLAEADGRHLTVDVAAELAGRHSVLPVDSQVMGAVVELWADYTLLATRLEADTMLAALDVAPVAEVMLGGLMLERLWDAAISVDTVVADEELAERFAAETPGARATASQILLLFGPEAAEEERDSVRSVAERLRAELAGGADFAALARRSSDDLGSGARGGSLGTFERGDMLPEVDSAIFALAPGELSHPVESEIGYHILRLDRIELPRFSEVADQLRLRIRAERVARAEEEYIAEVAGARGFRMATGIVGAARALAASPDRRLPAGAAERDLATWEGGAYRVGDLQAGLSGAPPELLAGLATASDEEWEETLRRQAETEMLVAEARSRGLAPSAEETDSIEAATRAAIRDLARAVGLLEGGAAGEAREEGAEGDGADGSTSGADTPMVLHSAPPSVEEAVAEAIAALLSGERSLVPLGRAAELLRSQGSWQIHEGRIEEAVSLAREIARGS